MNWKHALVLLCDFFPVAKLLKNDILESIKDVGGGFFLFVAAKGWHSP